MTQPIELWRLGRVERFAELPKQAVIHGRAGAGVGDEVKRRVGVGGDQLAGRGRLAGGGRAMAPERRLPPDDPRRRVPFARGDGVADGNEQVLARLRLVVVDP
jgi:hypothetical protein